MINSHAPRARFPLLVKLRNVPLTLRCEAPFILFRRINLLICDRYRNTMLHSVPCSSRCHDQPETLDPKLRIRLKRITQRGWSPHHSSTPPHTTRPSSKSSTPHPHRHLPQLAHLPRFQRRLQPHPTTLFVARTHASRAWRLPPPPPSPFPHMASDIRYNKRPFPPPYLCKRYSF